MKGSHITIIAVAAFFAWIAYEGKVGREELESATKIQHQLFLSQANQLVKDGPWLLKRVEPKEIPQGSYTIPARTYWLERSNGERRLLIVRSDEKYFAQYMPLLPYDRIQFSVTTPNRGRYSTEPYTNYMIPTRLY